MCEIYLPQPALSQGFKVGFLCSARIRGKYITDNPFATSQGLLRTPLKTPSVCLFKNHLIAQMLIELILFRVRGGIKNQKAMAMAMVMVMAMVKAT